MKSKQREVGVQLPFTVQDTRTYQELCKEAKEAIESTAKDWIPRFCMALKRQHPLMAAADIKKKVNNDWSSVWKGSTMKNYWPDWMKGSSHVEAGKASGRARNEAFHSKMKYETEGTPQQEQSTTDTSQTQQPETQAQKDAKKHHTLIQNVYGYEMGLTEFLTGYKEDQIIKLDDNLKLISETKDYRFDLTKKLAELDLKAVYRESRRLAMILNDFLKQLDDELGSRKKNAALTSE